MAWLIKSLDKPRTDKGWWGQKYPLQLSALTTFLFISFLIIPLPSPVSCILSAGLWSTVQYLRHLGETDWEGNASQAAHTPCPDTSFLKKRRGLFWYMLCWICLHSSGRRDQTYRPDAACKPLASLFHKIEQCGKTKTILRYGGWNKSLCIPQ